MATLPLSGIRVLDLSRVLAGPLATMILGDLGADVLKVERPGTGDETRGWGPPFGDRGLAAYYLSCNRNKLSLAADLAGPADLALLRALIDGADVVVDNFKRGTLERRGIDPEALLAEHPSLIWCTITGFGPDSDRPGYDFVVQAESGWMAITGEPDGAPMKSGVALADVIAGKDAAISILGALVARQTARPAADRRLFVSLAHSATAALVNVAQNALVTGQDARRWGNAHANLVPYQLFEARDRALVIAVGSDAQYAAAMRAIGLDGLAEDSRLVTNSGRLAHRDELVGAIAERVAAADAAHWMERLEAAGVPCGVVKPVLEALEGVATSAVSGVAPLAPAHVRLAPPTLDEHGPLVRAHGWDAFDHISS